MINKKTSKIKILFFGLGSIGTKHASIIKDNFDFKLYAYRTKKGQEKNELNIVEFENIKDAFSIKPEIAFITNPTFLHTETALECAKRNIALFIEKPISHSLESVDILDEEISKRNIFTYVGFNLRFHPVVVFLKGFIDKKKSPIYFRAVCSSYLPNWRPAQDYSRSYSAKKDMGGGVILELVHEFDYISWLFDGIKKINGFYDTTSSLKLDCEDLFEGQIICNKTKGSLHLDFFSRNVERKIQVYYDDLYLEADLINYEIRKIDDKNKFETISFKKNSDDMYKKQLEYFFGEYYKNNRGCMNNYSDALKTFKKIMESKEGKN